MTQGFDWRRALTGGAPATDAGAACRLACVHVLRLLAALQPSAAGEAAQELLEECIQVRLQPKP